MANEVQTHKGSCPTHGTVDATRDIPRAGFPYLINAARRYSPSGNLPLPNLRYARDDQLTPPPTTVTLTHRRASTTGATRCTPMLAPPCVENAETRRSRD